MSFFPTASLRAKRRQPWKYKKTKQKLHMVTGMTITTNIIITIMIIIIIIITVDKDSNK